MRPCQPQAASQAAFDKHFISLISHYGSVHAINLLGGGESEQVLSDAYNKHLESLIKTLRSDEETFETNDPVTLTAYDFHAQVRVGGHDLVKEDFQKRLSAIREAREKFRWTVVDRTGGEIVERQQGVFRTNVSGFEGLSGVTTILISFFLPEPVPGLVSELHRRGVFYSDSTNTASTEQTT